MALLALILIVCAVLVKIMRQRRRGKLSEKKMSIASAVEREPATDTEQSPAAIILGTETCDEILRVP